MSFDIGQRLICNHLDNNIDYTNNIPTCPKCLGMNNFKDQNYIDQYYYYDADWSFVDGSLIKVEDLPLLQELCLKAIVTVKGNCTFHPEFGTSITTSVAATTVSFEAVQRLIEKEVNVAMAGLQMRQDLQISLGQTLTDDERIYTVNKIETIFIDERTLSVNLYITTESGKDLTFSV
jgi:hypothetical protein